MPKGSDDVIAWVRKLSITTVAVALVLLLIFVVTAVFSGVDTPDVSASCTDISGAEADVPVCVFMEVVDTAKTRTRGLSGRSELLPNQAMLFDFESEGRRCMWMKDMDFSLDMVWLDDDSVIVDIESGVVPETYPSSFCGDEPSRYVIELNEGVASVAGLEIGQRIAL
jgi:uncharacterized membrane protein (UPF0127 family)